MTIRGNSYRHQYEISTSGCYSGKFITTVTTNPDGTRYVDCAYFGVSRDYKVSSDKETIELFLSEHNTTLVNIISTGNSYGREIV